MVYISPLGSEPTQDELKKLDFYKRMTRLFVILDQNYSKKTLINEFEVSVFFLIYSIFNLYKNQVF